MANKSKGPWELLEDASFRYALQYRPIAFQALVQTQDQAAFNELLEQAAGMEYYYLSIAGKEEGFVFPGPGSAERKVLETDYGFQAVRLEIAGERFTPVEYYYEPSYNLRPEVGMLLAFKTDREAHDGKDRTIRIKGPFDGKERSLNLSKTKLENIPNFKL